MSTGFAADWRCLLFLVWLAVWLVGWLTDGLVVIVTLWCSRILGLIFLTTEVFRRVSLKLFYDIARLRVGIVTRKRKRSDCKSACKSSAIS